MSKQLDGGPAFPVEQNVIGGVHCVGMSLRDYAAIHADMSNTTFNSVEAMAEFARMPVPRSDAALAIVSAAAVARLRYVYADAMLTEREKVR